MPPGIRQHLVERMRERNIGLADLNRLRLWIESQPAVPDGDWFKNFGSFKLCGKASIGKHFSCPVKPPLEGNCNTLRLTPIAPHCEP